MTSQCLGSGLTTKVDDPPPPMAVTESWIVFGRLAEGKQIFPTHIQGLERLKGLVFSPATLPFFLPCIHVSLISFQSSQP